MFEKHQIAVDAPLNAYGWTPLHTAAYKGNADMVVYLIGRGANIESVNQSGYTPLKLASQKENASVIALLERGSRRNSCRQESAEQVVLAMKETATVAH